MWSRALTWTGQELLPLFHAAIRAHPARDVRDQLTQLLLNLVKRPSAQQATTLVDRFLFNCCSVTAWSV
jgi:hypothetical protein